MREREPDESQRRDDMTEPTPVYINAGHKLTRCVRCGTIFPTGLEKEHEATRRDQHPAKKEIERRRTRGRGAAFFFALALMLVPTATLADTIPLMGGALTLEVASGLGGSFVHQTITAQGPALSLALQAGLGAGPLGHCSPAPGLCLPGSTFETPPSGSPNVGSGVLPFP